VEPPGIAGPDFTGGAHKTRALSLPCGYAKSKQVVPVSCVRTERREMEPDAATDVLRVCHRRALGVHAGLFPGGHRGGSSGRRGGWWSGIEEFITGLGLRHGNRGVAWAGPLLLQSEVSYLPQ
jgi:hypothetical protein